MYLPPAIDSVMPKLQERVTKFLQGWKEKEEVPDSVFEQKSKVQIAFVAIDHHNGHILAMVGGRDFNESKFNRAVQARRQPGSAFKPFLYTAAIDNGYPPSYRILNQPVVVNNPDGTRWDPENFDKKFGGLTTLREALRKSINLVAVRLILEIGPRAVVEYARRMGITTPLRPVPSLAIGSSEVIPLELVSAYGVFANQGIRTEPIAITRIEAGKTGTTNNYTDAWFVGFTPHLTAGVWVGLDDPELKLGPIGTGTVYDSLQLDDRPFRQPPDVVRLPICEDSGKLATNFCPHVYEEVFNVKYRPTETCDLHRGPTRRSTKKRFIF